MAKATHIIRSLNAGELSPLMELRTDQQKYVAGCRTMENAIPLIHGGAQERPGLEFISTQKDSTAKGRVVSFEHSVDDTYILLFENQNIRVYKDGSQVFEPVATEDLSNHTSDIKAHWKLNDNLATTAVVDADGATHDGVLYDGNNSTENTDVASDTDGADAINRSFDMSQLTGATGTVLVTDSGDFTFGDGTNDSAFTLHAWIKFTSTSARQDIMSKWSEAGQEWELYVDTDNKVVMKLWDDSAEVSTSIKADNVLAEDVWTFIVITYTGEGGATAANGLKLYTNWVLSSSTVTNNASYVAMEDKAGDVMLGGVNGVAQILIPQSRGTPIGNMNESGTSLADAFDGDNDEAASASATNTVNPKDTQVFIGKDWGAGNEKLITGFKAWGSNADEAPASGFISADDPTVKITLQGSTDNFSSSTVDLGNVSDTDAAGKLIQKLSGLTTTTAYRYHRLAIEYLTLPTTRNIHCAEAEFYTTGGGTWASKIDNMAVFDVELSGAEIAALVGSDTSTPLDIVSPYLTADLPSLKFEHSADVTFITHASYEPRRLSRLSDTSWILEESDLQTGPFMDPNTDTTKTIVSSGTTGSVTLTAVGHTSFVSGTTAGHEPSGSLDTSKSKTGALYKLVHAVSGTDASIGETLNSTNQDEATSTLAIPKGVTWDFTTNGTWGTGGPSTIVLERSYDSGTTFETVATVTSLANKNIVTSGSEDVADAIYRARVSDGSGTANASIQLSIRDTSHIGIVEITSVTSSTVAIGTVLTTLGSTDLTHRWSEGSFSNRRGWPIDVTISSEERLTFAGNVSEPLTTWGSVIGDFENFRIGTDDDDALILTLVGSGQQNRIRWLLSKNTLVIGTVGGEHILGASKDDEALTPSNIRARLQTTYGSEDIAAKIVNQAVLFIQRGGRKVREFLYDFGQDSHKADDLTVFSEHITESGIVDMAFQRTPDPTLWCVRNDGEMAIMSYERDQNVFSWSRLITHTNLAGTTSDSDFESVDVIYGGAGNEDEVWVTVRRTIGGTDARYVERFFQRDIPSDLADMKYLDSYITDTGGDTTITGLSHLEGQTVQVLGDGLEQATKVVSSGSITAATTAAKIPPIVITGT